MEEKKRLNSACISCIAKNHMEKYPENLSEEEQIRYKQRLFRLLAEAKTTDSAPLIVKRSTICAKNCLARERTTQRSSNILITMF